MRIIRSRTIKFYTLGCKVNQYDTQSIRERFLALGFKETRSGKPVHTCLINTCTVTSNADQKSKGAIRSCIKKNPNARIIVTGCLVKKDSASLSKIKGVDIIIDKRFFGDGISSFSGHTRAFLKVQDGCDNFCSYCKVPLVRGRSRSRRRDEVLREAKRLVDNGFKEIVLTGVCLGSYGSDLSPRTDLAGLTKELERINGLLRVRLSSIEAVQVTDGLIEVISESKKICRHLHIPIQSGDDKILKRMHRSYRRKDYLDLIRKVRRAIPGIAITTDCLVGFPGEGEDNFQNTVDLIRSIKPLKVHIFPYSAREGTLAHASLKDKVEDEIVRGRIAQLKKISDTCAVGYIKPFLGKHMDVLFESRVKEDPLFWEGYTDNYIKVRVKSGIDLSNRLTSVRLRDVSGLVVSADIKP